MKLKNRALSLVILGSLIFGNILNASSVFATLKNSKTLAKNDDETYTIKLSVTGEEITKTTADKTNVIIIFDRSGSMNTCLENYPAPYENYCLKDRRSEAIKATNSLLENLFSYNEVESETVEVAMIMFAKDVEVYREFSSEEFYLESYIFSDGGTNWEGALKKAYELAEEKNDGDKTHIIFITDGNPTHYLDLDAETGEEIVGGSGFETTRNIETSFEKAKVYAKKITDAGYQLHNLGTYGTVTRMEDLTNYANLNEKNLAEYFEVENAEELELIFNKLVEEITESITAVELKILDELTDFTELVEADGDLEISEDRKILTWNLENETIKNGETRETEFIVKPSEEVLDLVFNLVNEKVEWDEKYIEKGLIRVLENGEYKYFLKTNKDFPELSYRTLTTKIRNEKISEEKSEKIKVEMENPEPVELTAEKIQEEVEEPSEKEPGSGEEVGRGEIETVSEEEPEETETVTENPNTGDELFYYYILFLISIVGFAIFIV